MKHLNLTIAAVLLSFASFAQVAAISGPSMVCDGYTITLTDATTGGVWTSSTMAVAPVGPATGVVTGISSGVTTITYTVGAYYATHDVTVSPLPSPISGPSSACAAGCVTETDATPGGT